MTVPYLLYQVWHFIAPALYQRERKLLWSVLFSSSVLFYVGVAFAYFIVLPWVFQFFSAVAPSRVEVKPGMSQYFSFVVQLFLAFGFSFELPILIVVLDAAGVYTADRFCSATAVCDYCRVCGGYVAHAAGCDFTDFIGCSLVDVI